MTHPFPDLNWTVLQALGRPDAATRAAFLDEACAHNLTFRRQVDAILRGHDEGARGFAAVRTPAASIAVGLDCLLGDFSPAAAAPLLAAHA